MEHDELLYTLALQHVPNLGDSTAKKLIRHFNSAKAIFDEKPSNLLKIDGVGKTRIRELSDAIHLKEAEKELNYILKNNIYVSYYKEAAYPERLKHCQDAPILLFSRGNIDIHSKRIISIVGTRQITSHGIAFCEQLVEELAALDPVIISGFAYGTDITAHKAAIKNNLQTIACLAHGLNQIYPKPHKKYVAGMEANGGFYTDFWSTDSFDRNNFLKRNRIIAGLSEATIVIESAEKGGALVTADIANSYDREVFAVPGRPGDKASIGCNQLIKSENARLLTSAADVAYMLNWRDKTSELKTVQKKLFIELEPQEQLLYDQLEQQGKTELDLLALHCKIPTYKTASLLLSMELKGAVRPLPGKLFEIA